MGPYKAQWLAWRCPVVDASTALGMVEQWPGWRPDGGDGRIGPMVTEVTATAGLTSRRSSVQSWSNRAPSLRGLCRPFPRVWCTDHMGVVGTVPRGSC
jgi:hypothetical protein